MKKILQNKKGETIVEVVVAFVLLLMFTAVFTLALRFAQRTAVRAESEREAAFQATTALYPTDDKDAWNTTTNSNVTQGSENNYIFENGFDSFTISNVRLDSLTVNLNTDDSSTYTFHAYKKGTS